MDPKKLDKVVGKAIASKKFREGLFTEKRAELLKQFDLEADEFGALMSIRANTLAEFARGVNRALGRPDQPTRGTPDGGKPPGPEK